MHMRSARRIPSRKNSTTELTQLDALLAEEAEQKKRNQKYASAREVLLKLGTGAILIGTMLSPKSGCMIAKSMVKDTEFDEWKHYNLSYLRQTLRRLEKRKLISIVTEEGRERIVITDHGRKRILEYNLEKLEIQKTPRWDRRWRVIIYDIPQKKKPFQEHMRRTLQKMGFLQMQKSTYLIPYPCYKEIEFLKAYYGLGEHLKYMLVSELEDDAAYRTYFNL